MMYAEPFIFGVGFAGLFGMPFLSFMSFMAGDHFKDGYIHVGCRVRAALLRPADQQRSDCSRFPHRSAARSEASPTPSAPPPHSGPESPLTVKRAG